MYKVLQKLKEAHLFIKPEKYEFSIIKTTFLGFIISEVGLKIDPAKVNPVSNWEVPKSIKYIQCFLGFVNFYCHFIDKYLHLCQPFFNLLCKNILFTWHATCEPVFKALKKTFTSAPVLHPFDPDLETLVEMDISDYVTSGILSQKYPENGKLVLYPVAFISEKMTPAKYNYGIGDKEFLTIINVLTKWHIYLHQLPWPFTILTDHHNLQTFTPNALLSHCQAR